MENDKIEELKEVIDLVFEDIDQMDMPNVYSIINNEATKENLIEQIVNAVSESGEDVQSILWRIERSYNDNMLDD